MHLLTIARASIGGQSVASPTTASVAPNSVLAVVRALVGAFRAFIDVYRQQKKEKHAMNIF